MPNLHIRFLRLKICFSRNLFFFKRFVKKQFCKLKDCYLSFKNSLPLLKSKLQLYIEHYCNRIFDLIFKNLNIILFISFASLFLLSFIAIFHYNSFITPYFQANNNFENLKPIILTIAGALFGSSAIGFSLIMFAMQTNFEKIPFALFKKFSQDFKLLAYFGTTFFINVLVISSFFILDPNYASFVFLTNIWCIFFVFLFIFLAYKRAILLISPVEQLKIILQETKSFFKIVSKKIEMLRPLLQVNKQACNKTNENSDSVDQEKMIYFGLNLNWANQPKDSISYCFSFCNRYSEIGDYQIAREAFGVILDINKAYIEIRGKTFKNPNPFLGLNESTDSFINETLELARQFTLKAIQRQDELALDIAFRFFYQAVKIFIQIEYQNDRKNKFHAQLAAGYLSTAVENSLKLKSTDMTMIGIGLLGNAGITLLEGSKPENIVSIANTISQIAQKQLIEDKNHPAFQVCIQELTSFIIALFQNQNVKYSVKEVHKTITLLAKITISFPDGRMFSKHSANLSSFYASQPNSFCSSLTIIANKLLDEPEKSRKASFILLNIVSWSEGLYLEFRELFQLAVKQESLFTVDIVHWIKNVSNILLYLSNSRLCEASQKEELRKSAVWLFLTFSFVPDNENKILFLETFHLTETIFEAVINAYKIECIEVANELRSLLFNWARKSAKYDSCCSIFEKTILALIVINIKFKQCNEAFLKELREKLFKDNLKENKVFEKVFVRLKSRLKWSRDDFLYNSIDREIKAIDKKKFNQSIELILELLR